LRLRLPGWGGCCIPNPEGRAAAPALPGRPASHSRFATAIAKETHHQRACLSGFLTLGAAGVNQKRTILRRYPVDAHESIQPISYPGSPGLCLPSTSSLMARKLNIPCSSGQARMRRAPTRALRKLLLPPKPVPLPERDEELLQKGTAVPPAPLLVSRCPLA